MTRFKRFLLWKDKKGVFSIEAAIAMMAILMITFLAISYFTYLAPRQILTQEVHLLTQTAKIQGGLTDASSEAGNSDIERFLERLAEKGYGPEGVIVEATISSSDSARDGVSVIGVEPLSRGYIDNSLYSHRNSKEVIKIEVTIPAKKNFINAMSRFWTGEDSHLGDYHFAETIMSERW